MDSKWPLCSILVIPESQLSLRDVAYTIGEFVVRLCPGGFLVVDAKVPFAVFGHP